MAISNATLRILTALIGAPLLLGLVYLGGWPFGLLVVALAVLAQVEVYGLMKTAGLAPWTWAGLAIGALAALHPLWAPAVPLAVVGVLGVLAWSPFSARERPLFDLAATVFGVVYPSLLFAFLSALRLGGGFVDDAGAFALTLSVFLLIWATDTFAYYVGKNLGRHKLAPLISPKKTWEGAVGGAVGALLVAVVLKLTVLAFLAWPHVVAMALICGIVSQVGDLAESRLKRSVGAKDSGTLLPGHGGLLDRFDALLLAVPLVYLYLAYVARLFA